MTVAGQAKPELGRFHPAKLAERGEMRGAYAQFFIENGKIWAF